LLDVMTWRRLLAQGVLLGAVASRLSELHRQWLVNPTIRTALDQLIVAATAVSQRAPSDEQAVRLVSQTWCAELDRLINGGGATEAQIALLTDVRNRASAADPQDPFDRLFHSVTDFAAAVYGECWSQPELSLGWDPAHPRIPSSDPYAITAFTPADMPLRVEVVIYLEGFGPAAYAALPALMVHECVCHVPARQRGQVSNRSPFAEGFMDWAAKYFFEEWMPYIDADLAPAAYEHRDGLDQVVTRPGTSEGAARLRGREAAINLLGWLRVVKGLERNEAEAWLAKLAQQLNCLDVQLNTKNAMVVDLADPWDTWPSGLVGSLNSTLENGAPADVLLL
jgi:hypothetical protein